MSKIQPATSRFVPGGISPEIQDQVRQVRPFFWLLNLVLALIYGWSLYNEPQLRVPGRLLLFTSLMVVHGVLHWYSPYLSPPLSTERFMRLTYLYFLVQGGIVFVLALMSGEQSVIMGLYLALVGAAVGIIQKSRHLFVILLFYLGLSAISFSLIWGLKSILPWFLGVILMAFFVIVYVSLFSRQAQAQMEALELLRNLETAHQQLSEYATQVEDLTRIAERQRMARELHDTLAQGVAGLILQLEAANAHASENRPAKAREIIQQAMARARTTLADARRAIDDLRSEEDDSQDLAAAVRGEVARFTRSTGIPCDLTIRGRLVLPEPLQEHVQRILAESLTNVLRHAQARKVWLRLAAEDDALEMIVRDDGIGFEPENTPSRSGHYGLMGMRERARLANGSLTLSSRPGAGTQLRLRLPLPAAEE